MKKTLGRKLRIAAASVIACAVSASGAAYAAEPPGYASGTKADSITPVAVWHTISDAEMGRTYSGTLSDGYRSASYRFQIDSASCVKITHYQKDGSTYVINERGERLMTVHQGTDYIYLSEGTYYATVEGGSDYSVRLQSRKTAESFPKGWGRNDNRTDTANRIRLNKKYKGQVDSSDHVDIYRVSIPSAGRIKISYDCLKETNQMPAVKYELTDRKGRSIDIPKSVRAGTYYLRFFTATYDEAGSPYCFTVRSSAKKTKKTKNTKKTSSKKAAKKQDRKKSGKKK